MSTERMSCPDDSTARPQGCGTWRDVFADALRLKTAAERLGVSPAAVDEMLRSGELVAVRMGGEWLLPVWQFSADGVLPGVRSVLRRRPGSFVSLSTWAPLRLRSCATAHPPRPSKPRSDRSHRHSVASDALARTGTRVNRDDRRAFVAPERCWAIEARDRHRQLQSRCRAIRPIDNY